MRVRIQVVESEAGDPPLVPEIATLERGSLQPDGLGLTLAEAKDLLRGVQETMVAEQVAAFVAQQERCPDCDRHLNHRVEFLTDGGDTVRELPRYLVPESEPWLDWFPIPMRLTVRGPMTKGLAAERNSASSSGEEEGRRDASAVEKQLGSLKWHLWHGTVSRALPVVADLEWDLEASEEQSERAKRLLKAVSEFHPYIAANQFSIPNDGERSRHGEAITTSFAESTVNQVISRRMVKQQHMRWTERGAPLLLPVRTRVLKDELRATFECWYPGLKAEHGPAEEAAT